MPRSSAGTGTGTGARRSASVLSSEALSGSADEEEGKRVRGTSAATPRRSTRLSPTPNNTPASGMRSVASVLEIEEEEEERESGKRRGRGSAEGRKMAGSVRRRRDVAGLHQQEKQELEQEQEQEQENEDDDEEILIDPLPVASSTTAAATTRPARRALLLHLLRPLSHLPPILPPLLLISSFLLLFALPIPHKPFHRATYVDENALQPAAGRLYWDWQQVEWADKTAERVNEVLRSGNDAKSRASFITSELESVGLFAHAQSYTYSFSSSSHTSTRTRSGTNAYGHLRASRSDGRESILILAPWKSSIANHTDEENAQVFAAAAAGGSDAATRGEWYERLKEKRDNVRGVALALTLARFLGQFKYWSKDFIFLFPHDDEGDELAATRAWLTQYYGSSQANLQADALQIPRSLIWTGLSLDYPSDSFSSLQLTFEGVNGAEPNLDVLNTFVRVAQRVDNVPIRFDSPSKDDLPYAVDRAFGALSTWLDREYWDAGGTKRYLMGMRNVARQAGRLAMSTPLSPAGLLTAFHIDAIGVSATPANGPYGFYQLGRIIESNIRSFSNLLERLHHSQFFYLVTEADKFVQFATLLPTAILPAVALSCAGLLLWNREGREARVRAEELINRSVSTLSKATAGNGVLASMTAAADVPLRRPTMQHYRATLLEAYASSGALLTPSRLAKMDQSLSGTQRPTGTALTVIVTMHALAAATLCLMGSAPLQCAKEGLWRCDEIRWIAVLLLGAFALLCVTFAALQRTRAPGTTSPLPPTLHALTLLHAGMLVASVSTLNFSLAALSGIMLGAPLYLFQPRSSSEPAPTVGLRFWSMGKAAILLALHPILLLLLSQATLDRLAYWASRDLLGPLPDQLSPIFMGLGIPAPASSAGWTALARQISCAVDLLVDRTLANDFMLGTKTMSFFLLGIGTIHLQAAVANALGALG
ncbi:Gaa1-domain-containing protein [Ceraceosorus guamensis]|uniref:Gaa1-domain-containing protein n=1 Tax=Ceraceosorus guamensis TaxID=1522189 RepID=A0A316VTD6_9BASI|nr:Gaa1-domain-containing protein [Ceraceosorus guamensis]PWN40752.1 Gaa1-domain-containing protein [Ceraceosorus guamensis]